MSTPSLPMQIGVPLDEMSLLFFACLGIAVWFVYLFCRQRFAERSVTESSDWIYQLLPRHLATRDEYSKGFLTYFGTLAVVVVLLSLLGPKNLATLGITLPQGIGYVVVPFFIAFVLIGALPTVPGLIAVEKYLRTYAHRRAFIPDAARATADRLAAAGFDFTAYQSKDMMRSPEMRGVEPADFTHSPHSLEHSWARLCCLISVQKSGIEGMIDSLDASLLRDYKKDLETIENQKKSMEPEVAAYRAANANDPLHSNEDLRRSIRDNLYKLYVLLGCAVRLKLQPPADIDLALAQLGFKLKRSTREPSHTGDIQLVALTVVAGGVAVMGLVAWGLGQFAWWQISPMFPQTIFQPFIDSASMLVPNATAILLADAMRKRLIGKGRWFSTWGSRRRGNVANHIRVALVSGVGGYLGLILWGFVQQAPTSDGLIIDAPFALLAMVTGGFYVYHLDNAEIGSRPSRPWELGSQTALTAVCGLIAACAAGELIFGNASAVTDKIVLATAVSAVAGLVFALYFPRAAAAARYNPLAAVGEERVGALDTAARVRFGDAAATVWLDQRHPALGNNSPRDAAAVGVEGFERAMSLVQGPRVLAA